MSLFFFWKQEVTYGIKVQCACATGGCHTPFSLSWTWSLLAEVSAGLSREGWRMYFLRILFFDEISASNVVSLSPFCEIEKYIDEELRYYWNNDSNIERYSPERRKRWHQHVPLSMTMTGLAWRSKAKVNRRSDLEDPQWTKGGQSVCIASTHSLTHTTTINKAVIKNNTWIIIIARWWD